MEASLMPMKREFLMQLAKAESFFQEGRSHDLGNNGQPRDKFRAMVLYSRAVNLGSAEAALHIGLLFREGAVLTKCRESGYRYMLRFFSKAAALGCADGLYHLYEEFHRGVRVRKNQAIAARFLHKAAMRGSIRAMAVLGLQTISRGNEADGRRLLERALLAGYGDAGYYLAMFYARQRNDSMAMLKCLRAGARRGSDRCRKRLEYICESGLNSRTCSQGQVQGLLVPPPATSSQGWSTAWTDELFPLAPWIVRHTLAAGKSA